MKTTCGYCGKSLITAKNIYIKELNGSSYIPYCSKEHQIKDTV